MHDTFDEEPSRSLVWQRVKEAAQRYHDHPAERGTSKLLALDAGVSPQLVSDWKAGRAPLPMRTIGKLAALYGVSAGYLAGYTSDPAATVSRDEAQQRARMVELVDDVVTTVYPGAGPRRVAELCSLALEMIQAGESDANVVGRLYQQARHYAALDGDPPPVAPTG